MDRTSDHEEVVHALRGGLGGEGSKSAILPNKGATGKGLPPRGGKKEKMKCQIKRFRMEENAFQ